MSDDERQNYDDYKADLKSLVQAAAVDAIKSPLEEGGTSMPSLPSRLTALETIIKERNRVAESNGKWLAAVAAAVVIQIMFGLVSAGTKYQLIDDIKSRLLDLKLAFDAHQSADAIFREQENLRIQVLRSELEKEIYYRK